MAIQDELRLESPGFPANVNNFESILRWPIFNDLALSSVSFVLENEREDGQMQSGSVPLSRGIQEDELQPLSERFLSYVHVKNPILDVADFRRCVNDTSINGLQWDGESCLIVSPSEASTLKAGFDEELLLTFGGSF